jgi:hypothetical protein
MYVSPFIHRVIHTLWTFGTILSIRRSLRPIVNRQKLVSRQRRLKLSTMLLVPLRISLWMIAPDPLSHLPFARLHERRVAGERQHKPATPSPLFWFSLV